MAQPLKIQSLMDPAWFKDGTNDCVYIEAYEMALAPPTIKGRISRFEKMVVMIGAVQMDYLEIGAIKVKFGEARQVEVTAEHKTSTSELSPKVLTLQPHLQRHHDNERLLVERSSEIVSLLVATNFRNIAFRRIFSNILGYLDNSIVAHGPYFRLPFDLPKPDLSDEAYSRFVSAQCNTAVLSEEDKRRVTLSLQWHLKGITADGVDSLLSLWVAIETIAMKSTNISDVNVNLAAIYGVSKEEAASEFGIGRIFGLRSAIVHNGERRVVSTHLTDYLECLYADLLVYNLNLPTMHRSRKYLNIHALDIKALTP